MKSSLSKPLLRMATAGSNSSSGLSNSSPNAQPRPSFPLLHQPNSRMSSFSSSSSSSSSSPLNSLSSTSTTVSRPPHNNILFMKRNFSSRVYPSPLNYGRSFLPLGALALIGGALLYLSNSTTDALSVPFFSSKPTPASRMKERLDKHGFYEKLVVPDGNCQMRSISDQLHGNENKHPEVRSKIMSWLSKNEKFAVDDTGSATLGDFIDRDNFPREYSYHLGAWGDHITLLAAAEVYGISIISNVDDGGTNQYVTLIKPRTSKSEKTLNLSHWHEMHYNSLYPVTPQQAA